MPLSKNSTDTSIDPTQDASVAEASTEAAMPLVRPVKPVTSLKRPLKKRQIVLLVLALIAILGIAGTAYFYNQYETLKKNPNAEQQAEVAALVKEVGQYMLLPNETPTVATVEDITALKSQPFFVNAKNGDKVLVFVNARQAILYRPSQHLIINVAPLYFQNGQATAQEQAAVQPVVKTPTKSSASSSTTASSSSSN